MSSPSTPTTAPSHAAAAASSHAYIPSSYLSKDANSDEFTEKYVVAAHNYLMINGHTSKSTSIDLAKLCSVESIIQYKPSKSFKASEALRANTNRFHVWIRHGGASAVYALAPPLGEGNRKRTRMES